MITFEISHYFIANVFGQIMMKVLQPILGFGLLRLLFANMLYWVEIKLVGKEHEPGAFPLAHCS